MKVVVLLVLVISASLGAVAQSAVDGNCPTVSVVGPSYEAQTGDNVAFKAEIKGLSDEKGIEYLWFVSTGEIISGQGTKEILITRGPDWRYGITATIELKGFRKECINFASETLAFEYPAPSTVLIDRYSNLKFSDELMHFASLEQVLRKDPSASGYVIVDVNDISEQAAAVKRAEKLLGQLATKDKGMASRIRIGVGVAASNNTSLYMPPPGATPPDCSADCIWVQQ